MLAILLTEKTLKNASSTKKCISYWHAHAHLILTWACASHIGLPMRISFWPAHAHLILPAHAHLILTCACASHFVLHMRISFWPAPAHLILACACAYYFDLCMRISNLSAHAHLKLACAYASHFDLRMRISFWPAMRTHFSVDLRLTNNKSQITHTDSWRCVIQSSYIEVHCWPPQWNAKSIIYRFSIMTTDYIS